MNYWKNITAIYNKQTAKGLAEYGQKLERNKSLNFIQRIRMIMEELVDALVYCEHALQMEAPCVECEKNGSNECQCVIRRTKMKGDN